MISRDEKALSPLKAFAGIIVVLCAITIFVGIGIALDWRPIPPGAWTMIIGGFGGAVAFGRIICCHQNEKW